MSTLSLENRKYSQIFATVMIAAVLVVPAYLLDGVMIGVLLAVTLLARELVTIYNIRSVPLRIFINAGAGSLGIIFTIQVVTMLSGMTSAF